MSVPVATGLTYDDLASFPDDDLRRELIDGQLFLSPSPIRPHQDAVEAIVGALHIYRREHGGKLYFAPMDVHFSDRTVVEPDVLFIAAERVGGMNDRRFVDIAPDLVVEVSSPATRRLDLIRKRALYEREGVREYWFVDLDELVIDVYRLDETGHYVEPETLAAGQTLTCLAAPGLAIPVADVFA